MKIRRATAADLDSMVALSEAKRGAYETRRPLFWRRAKDSATRQRAFFASIVGRDDHVALVAEDADRVAGFLVARLAAPPPVYEPGGLACTIDDFAVASPVAWETAGAALLREGRRVAREKGAAVVVVVCGAHDEPKRRLLAREGLSVASEWYVAPT